MNKRFVKKQAHDETIRCASVFYNFFVEQKILLMKLFFDV